MIHEDDCTREGRIVGRTERERTSSYFPEGRERIVVGVEKKTDERQKVVGLVLLPPHVVIAPGRER